MLGGIQAQSQVARVSLGDTKALADAALPMLRMVANLALV